MKTNNLKIRSLMLAASFIIAITLTNCKKDETPAVVTIESINADGTDLATGSQTSVDLNGTASATDVPLDAVITITFAKDVNTETVSTSSVTLNDGTSDLDITVSASGKVVTITPTNNLARGIDHSLALNDQIKAADGGAFSATSRSFKSAGRAEVIPPQAANQIAYWTFDGHANDEMGVYNASNVKNITYIEDRFGLTSSTASFNGDGSIIEIPNGDVLMNTADFTLSFWVKSNSTDLDDDGNTRGQFVMGLAAWQGFQFEIFGNYGGCKLAARYEFADGTTGSEDTWWSTEGNLGWQGWTFDDDVSGAGGLAAIMKDEWAHVVCSYDATNKIGTMYMNGKLRKSWDFNLWPDGDAKQGIVGMKYDGNASPGNHLAFGFIQGIENRIITDDWANPEFGPDNNHFKGELDDIRIFHAAYSATDVSDLYNAEK